MHLGIHFSHHSLLAPPVEVAYTNINPSQIHTGEPTINLLKMHRVFHDVYIVKLTISYEGVNIKAFLYLFLKAAYNHTKDELYKSYRFYKISTKLSVGTFSFWNRALHGALIVLLCP